MQVVSRIRDVFRIELPLNIMFETRNIIELARHIRRAKSVQDGQERATALAPRPRTGKIPLSFSQQRLWFIDQLEPGGNQYNIPAAIRIHGKLNHEVFEKALNSVIQRHESLRTVFRNEKGEPVQVIKEESGLAIPVYDLSHLNADERERQAQSLAEKEVKRPFNLAAGPLLRVVIIKLEAEDQVVVFSLHHIISDGWSVGILIREFADFYKSMEKKESAVLPELPVQYADFAAWQREWLKGTALEEQLRYWKEKLAGAPPLLELPLDFPRPAVQTFNGGRESILLPEDLLKKMKEKSRAQNATLFMMLLALFKILLYRYSGEGDLVVGSPIAGRNHSEIEDLIGFFVNNLVLRTKLSRNETFQEVLEKVRETALEAYLHQDIPFEKLVEELHPVRDLSHSPLFQVMFVMQNLPVPEFKLPGLSVSGFELDGQTSSYDLSLVIQEAPDGLAVEMEYNTDLFRAETIRRMLGHYHRLLTSVSDTDECKIGDIPLLSQNERESITVEWNQTAVNYPENMTAHQIFESVSADFPDSVAVHYSGNISPEDPQKVTYSELNRRANQLAHYLRKMGLRPEGTVAICMERSVEMIMAILAVLKAGGAFLPVDPAHPISRREYMMQDSGTAILLTQEKLLGQSVPDVPQIIAVDRDWDKIRRFGGTNPDSPVTPQNLAYIIYTSGSTGKPKGTLLQHGGLANLATVQKVAFDIQPGKRIMQFSSLSFDASVWEFVMALLNGATLCLTTREVIMSGRNLSGYLRDEKINIITLPPSVLAVLPPADLPELQVLVTAGEAVSTQLVETWCNGRRFFNAYGPTETTVCASMHQCRQGSAANPPIGKPIGNFQLFITEHPLQPVPVGVQAELCVAGAGLARGYMNRPDLTAEKFMPHPFANRAGERLYRTGDLTRYLADGNIEFIGRIDSQVKVRGFRIEPGEIDALLMKHSEIQDSITVVREPVPGDKRLISYIVTSGENEVDVTGIKEYLRGRLPEYMIPSALMPLAKLPLNSSGKVDRKALPMPEVTRDTLGTEYVAPRNETEKKLVDITAGLLAAEKVGVNDNFFELGGHSLLATQFMARVLENFGVELPLRILFEKPTVAGIAEEIGKFSNTTEKPAAPAIKKVSRDAHRLKRSEIS